MDPNNISGMDPNNISEMAKHLDKQNEFLEQSRTLMLHEIEKLQVEHEMLMSKFFQLTKAQEEKKSRDDNQHCDNAKTVLSATLGSSDESDQR